MFDHVRNTSMRRVYPRLLGDFILIHLSMVAAFSLAVTSLAALGQQVAVQNLLSYFPKYYLGLFLPLSPMFLVVFFLSGFYTKAYNGRYQLYILLRGGALAVVLFLTVNYLMFRSDLISRSVALWFSALALTSITSTRIAKRLLLRRAEGTVRSSSRSAADQGAVLVVGGAGYIGSILVRRLLEEGYKVRLLDRLVYGYAPIRDMLKNPNFRLIAGDCRNIQAVVGAARGASSIIHLAAIVGDPACEQDHQGALEINYAATRMLVEVAKGQGIRRLIFASSCSVYGANDLTVDERSEVNPISFYARTKIDSENALLQAQSEHFQPTILRFSTVFGYSYRPRFDLVVNLLTAKAFQEKTITIFNGEQWRPFIHVKDVAEAILHVMKAPLSIVGGQIFNGGDSRLNYTLSDVAKLIKQTFPETVVEQVENSDRRNYKVSFEKIRNQLGFRCRLSLEDGIRELKKALELREVFDYKEPSYDNQKFLKSVTAFEHADEIDARVMAAFAGEEHRNGNVPTPDRQGVAASAEPVPSIANCTP
jgi:nucleoside-diphosphate-sugar epimerase